MAAKQQVIVKKVKVAQDGAHGGAWKVAYADFVTAMMAFFLLLWLLNATEQEVLDGISNYLSPTTLTASGTSGSGGLFGGITANDPGPTEDQTSEATTDTDSTASGELKAENEGSGKKDEISTGSDGKVDPREEENTFNTTKDLLESSLDQLPPELESLKETIQVDVTEEGLRVQLLDSQSKGTFKRGTAELTEHGRNALTLVAQYVERLPNEVSITGHTDGSIGETQGWDLSIARANTARRTLTDRGIPAQRIKTVVGKADTDLLIPENPLSPKNRRIAIVLLRRSGIREDGRPVAPSLPPSVLE